MSIVAGELSKISDYVHRVTAPNPGLMTGPGTNTYLLGKEQLIIVDPGPADASHIAAICAAIESLEATPQWIFVTHTHPDHSPAAKQLSEKYAIPVWGNEMPQDGFQDETFSSSFEFQDGQVITTSEIVIRAVHTPGHVSNHFCFLVGSDQHLQYLLTGDHIMQGSTVVIIPPAGDMSDYMCSLSKLLEVPFDHILPAHGEMIVDGITEISWLITHRLAREQKVIDALLSLNVATVEMMVKAVYQDVDESLHLFAALSLEAHLLKLLKEQKVSCDQSKQWRWIS